MPVPQNAARLPEAFWTKGSWHRQDSKRQRCLWAIPWKLNTSQNSLESESREVASEHFVSHSCCWPLCFIIFLKKIFFPFWVFSSVFTSHFKEDHRKTYGRLDPHCSPVQHCLPFVYHHLLMSMVLAANKFILHFTEVRGEILIEKLNKIPHKMVPPDEHRTWKRQTSGCLEPRTWFFFPIRYPRNLPALAGDQLIWKLIPGGERSVLTGELYCNPCLRVPASPGFLSVLP